MSYGDIFNGSYYLSRDNMKIHLEHEHEQKMNVIDNIHQENMDRLSNERNRDNNKHYEEMQALRNQRNRDENRHSENMEQIMKVN